MAIIFITHNLGVVAEIADRVMVMYAGRVVERGEVRAGASSTRCMPYTKGLLRSVPRLGWTEGGRVPLAAIPAARCPTRLICPPAAPSTPAAPTVTRPAATPACRTSRMPARGHDVRCLRWREILDAA